MEHKRKQQPARRQPGASAKRPPEKAPHAQPRKHPAPPPEPTRTAPEVVYMAPKPFSRSRLILRLASVVAVVIAVMLGLSIFFKVEYIEVSGCSQYTAWEVQQASGIQEGDQLLTFSVARAAAKITNALPYVKTVRIGISLPDTVKIEIVETRVTYALQDQSGNWWLMDSGGKLLERCESGTETDHTVVTGVTLSDPAVGQQAVALQTSTNATLSDGTAVPVTVTAQQRLETVVAIAGYLEENGIIGQVSSLDVTSLFEIGLWYGDQYQVTLGDTEDLDTKILYLKSIVDQYAQERPYERGALDLSDISRVEYQSFTEEP